MKKCKYQRKNDANPLHYFQFERMTQQRNQYSIECTQAHMAGAIYCMTDMIIFTVYKALTTNKQYLHICITYDDEMSEMLGMFEWENVPTDIMQIYDYVSSKSCTMMSSDHYKLYGTHIGRTKDYKMHIGSFNTDPNNSCNLHIIQSSDVTNQIGDLIKEIGENMCITKKLCV
jgi:hypothetical protein